MPTSRVQGNWLRTLTVHQRVHRTCLTAARNMLTRRHQSNFHRPREGHNAQSDLPDSGSHCAVKRTLQNPTTSLRDAEKEIPRSTMSASHTTGPVCTPLRPAQSSNASYSGSDVFLHGSEESTWSLPGNSSTSEKRFLDKDLMTLHIIHDEQDAFSEALSSSLLDLWNFLRTFRWSSTSSEDAKFEKTIDSDDGIMHALQPRRTAEVQQYVDQCHWCRNAHCINRRIVLYQDGRRPYWGDGWSYGSVCACPC